jgi:hypothetical protein
MEPKRYTVETEHCENYWFRINYDFRVFNKNYPTKISTTSSPFAPKARYCQTIVSTFNKTLGKIPTRTSSKVVSAHIIIYK